MAQPSMQRKREYETATIANGGSLSAAVNLQGRVLCGVIMPSAWTAAGLSFQASHDGSTYVEVMDFDGVALATVVTASVYVPLDAANFAGANYVKVRSGTSGAAVNQGAERAITLVAWEDY